MTGSGYTGGANTGAADGIQLTGATSVSTTGSGTIGLTGTGGGSGNGSSSQGIRINTTAALSGGTGAITLTGTAGSGTGGLNYGIYLNDTAGTSVIQSGGRHGDAELARRHRHQRRQHRLLERHRLQSRLRRQLRRQRRGRHLYPTGTLNTSGGNITLGGGSLSGGVPTGAAYGDALLANGVVLSESTLNAGGGNITMTGNGYTGGTNTAGAYGIYVQGGNGAGTGVTLQTSGTGTISLNGTGGGSGSGNTNYGINIGGNATTISTNTGAISLTGTGGNTTATANYGVYASGGSIAPAGAAPITITGTVGTGSNYGVVLGYAGNLITSAGGSVTLASPTSLYVNTGITYATGTSFTAVFDADTGGTSGQIDVEALTAVSTNGGNIYLGGGSLDGSGHPTGAAVGLNSGTNSNYSGIYLIGGTLNAGGGNITITGQSGTYASGNDDAIRQSGATIQTSGSGTITLTGTGSNVTTTGQDRGIWINGGNITTSGTGLISLTGTGGGQSGAGNYGVNMAAGAIAPTGAAPITITGTAGYGTTYGVEQTGGTITGAGGTVTLASPTGVNVGAGSITYATGASYDLVIDADTGAGGGMILLNAAGSISTGGGNVYLGGGSLDGSGHPTGSAFGVSGQVYGIEFVNFTLNAGGGNITMVGQGYGSGSNNYGIYLHGPTIQTSGSGNISLTGTGGGSGGSGNYGVYLDKGGSAGNITSTGSGAINITGIGGTGTSNYGIATDANADSIGGASYSGDITLKADTVSFGTGTNIQTSGNITMKEYTSGQTIGVDGGAGNLSLTSAYMGYFNWGGTLTIGDSNSGNLTANADSTRLNTGSVALVSGGNITLGGAWSKSSGSADTLTLEATGNIAVASYAISGASGYALSVIMDAGSGGGSDAISGLGNITTYGGNIYLGGGALSGGIPSGYSVGTSSSGSQYGLYLNAVTLNAGGGNISLSGEGGTYASGGDDGIYVHGSTIQTSGSGTITLNGEGGTSTSGTNYGVYLDKSASAGNITSTGSGAISVTGISGSGGTDYGMATDANSDSIGGGPISGNITLTAGHLVPRRRHQRSRPPATSR